MSRLTPGPEDAKKQDHGAGDLAAATHTPKTIPAGYQCRAAASTGFRYRAQGRPVAVSIRRPAGPAQLPSPGAGGGSTGRFSITNLSPGPGSPRESQTA